jgi:lambda family phage portal protein
VKLCKRAWESAWTDRINSDHWRAAKGASKNLDLVDQGRTLRDRCEHEAQNNPLVEGIIDTHIVDLIGSGYPILQVQSDDEIYNEGLETFWREFWEMPDYNGQLSGADFLQLMVRGFWTAGESFWQLITDETADTVVNLRILGIHPRRIQTPADHFTNDIIMGVHVTPTGRPTAYYVQEFDEVEVGIPVMPSNYLRVDKVNMLHVYFPHEHGQLRAAPWLAPSLDTCAELRDYDTQVLDAARAAADFSVLLHTSHPDAQYLSVNESTTVERRTMRTLPPGWDAKMIQPEQPQTNYVEYRSERQRDIGRVKNMPLMTIRLDSAKHSYSSARFDGQVYQRGNVQIQGGIERKALNPLVWMVAREAELARKLPQRPRNARLSWTWPVPPHVDPSKEAVAIHQRLLDGTIDYFTACAHFGSNGEDMIARRVRIDQLLQEAGLPTVAEMVNPVAPAPAEEEEEEVVSNA